MGGRDYASSFRERRGDLQGRGDFTPDSLSVFHEAEGRSAAWELSGEEVKSRDVNVSQG